MELNEDHEGFTLDVVNTSSVDGLTKLSERIMIRHTYRDEIRGRKLGGGIRIEHGPITKTTVETREA